MTIRRGTLTVLQEAGINAETPEAELKAAYYKAAGVPLNKNNIESVRKALGGDESQVTVEKTAGTTVAKEPKAAKAPKAPKEPKPVTPSETPEQALARLQSDDATKARWARVTKVEEMGKKGPTKVTILCDDKGPEGQDLFRTIKVQDLFQVRYSADFAKKNARKNRVKKAKPEATATATA
jgi:hypothetical protein